MFNSSVMYLENSVKKYPDRIAVEDKNGKLSYKELWDKAQRYAHAIKATGVAIQKPIAVYLPKSAECIAAFMGILYAGNCYVPVDTNMPSDRLEKIFSNLQPEVILTYRKLSSKLEGLIKEYQNIIYLDEVPEDAVVPVEADQVIDTDPAYILYTSGSTGVPKGVVISHRSIIDYIDWANQCYAFDSTDRIGSQAPFYFDNSTLDIYASLSNGATLVIIPEMLYSFPAKLMNYVRDEKITSIFWVPSVLVNVANTDSLAELGDFSLRRVLFAGEVMPNKQLNYWRKKFKDILFSNLYGPTEITVDCTYYDVDREFRDDEPLPIGKPCRNSDVIVLSDTNERITWPGEIGELCVRGSSLALGYWQNAEKTEAAFVQNPLHNNYPERIYRTGDLVQWNERGELLYSGRKDSQIKHMGYRIELGEIETAAGSMEGLHKVCALYDSKEQKIVLLYEAEEEKSVKDLRLGLMNLLPKYMIPMVYKWYKTMPLNMNGKIDRKRLQDEYIGAEGE